MPFLSVKPEYLIEFKVFCKDITALDIGLFSLMDKAIPLINDVSKNEPELKV